jgi:hypothetical protein
VLDEPIDSREVLDQWRDATRAAELTDRLAYEATESAQQADMDRTAAEAIVEMAQRVSRFAARAARVARETADRVAASPTRRSTDTGGQ